MSQQIPLDDIYLLSASISKICERHSSLQHTVVFPCNTILLSLAELACMAAYDSFHFIMQRWEDHFFSKMPYDVLLKK